MEQTDSCPWLVMLGWGLCATPPSPAPAVRSEPVPWGREARRPGTEGESG